MINAWVWPPPPTHIAALALSLLSGTLFWASLNSVRGTLEIQFASGMSSTLLSAVLVLLVNRDLRLPTRQQLASAGFYAITEASILVQARLLLGVRRSYEPGHVHVSPARRARGLGVHPRLGAVVNSAGDLITFTPPTFSCSGCGRWPEGSHTELGDCKLVSRMCLPTEVRHPPIGVGLMKELALRTSAPCQPGVEFPCFFHQGDIPCNRFLDRSIRLHLAVELT